MFLSESVYTNIHKTKINKETTTATIYDAALHIKFRKFILKFWWENMNKNIDIRKKQILDPGNVYRIRNLSSWESKHKSSHIPISNAAHTNYGYSKLSFEVDFV